LRSPLVFAKMQRFGAPLATLLAFADAKAVLNIIRHGEKMCEPSSDLSTEGEDRAQYIAKCMSSTTVSRGMPMGKATMVHASQYQEGHTKRTIQTSTPLAETLGLELQTPCLKDDFDCFAKEVQKMSDGDTMVAVWTNDEIQDLLDTVLKNSGVDAEALVGHSLSKWTHDCPSLTWEEPACSQSGKTCYDEIWQIIFENGVPTEFHLLREGFAGEAAGPCLGDLAEDHGVVSEGGSCQLAHYQCDSGLACEERPSLAGKWPRNKVCVQSDQSIV